nr:unnamed protein product [Leishmania braziliensis]
MRSRAFANFTGASVEKEEEPRPSGVAPQPAPAPPRSSQLASSRRTASVEWLSAPTANTSPHSRWYTSSSSHSWQPMWRAPVRSRTDGMCRSGGDDSGIPETPFRWRSSLLHSARTSLLTPVSHGKSHAVATGSTLHPETSIRHVSEQLGRSPVGAFTPNIRYRTSTGASSDTRTAPCQLSTAIVKESVNSNGGSRHCRVSPARRASVEWTPPASIHPAHTIAPLLRPSVPTRPSLLQSHRKTQGEAILRRRPPLLATTHQGAAAVSTSFSAGGIPTRSARVVTLCVPAEIAVQPNGDSARRTRRRASLSVSSTSSVAVAGTSPVSNLWMQPERRDLALRRGHGEVAEEAEVVAGVTRSSSHAPVHHAEAEEDDEVGGSTETIAIGHLTLRSFTEEYSRFSTEGTVGWVGLQTHLRCHTQSSQIFTLDLTCCHMRRDQWTWFTQDILPQLRVLEVLHLVQMHLEDEAVAELVRGSCGLSAAADGRRTASRSWQQSPSSESRHGCGGSGDGSGSGGRAMPSAPLAHLRVLDLSGNAVTQRSCTHLGKMMLWMAGTLEEVRLLGNPLKDYGMQTLSVYVSKLNLETLEQDSSLFPAALRELCAQVRQTCRRGHAERSGVSGLASSSAQSAAAAGVVHAGCSEDEGRGDASDLVAGLPLGPVLLDLRDCRASVRGLSEMLAAASRAHRLRTLVLSHNVAGVTSLLPLPASEYHGAANLAKEEEEVVSEEREARPRCSADRDPQPQPLPLPHRLRLVKTPLVYSGALMRRKLTGFSDMAVFTTSCALSTLVLYGVPLSQTCSPLGFRELLLNIFFSCPLLDLVDLSDTFEWSLLPPEARLALLTEGNRRDAVEQRLHGLEGRQGLHVYGENEGEVEFRLDSAVVSGQTRLGDIFGELMAHAALNAVVRHRLLPAAFLHVRELHLSSTGLTDSGAHGLCMGVRRGRSHTGMLASLVVLNLSDNLMTVRGCVRVISTFLLDDDAKGDVDATRSSPASPGTATATRGPMRIAPLTALALQRNAGIESSRSDGTAAGMNGGSNDGADNAEYLQQVCTAAEEAVLRRATLRSAACLNQACRSSSTATRNAATQEEQVPSLTVYFSAPPPWAATRPMSSSVVGDPRPPSTFLSSAASMDVFYAGCDDQGDAYCTCPCSRFYVPKPASAEATHREDPNGAGLPYSSQQQQWTSAAASRILAGAATARGGQAVSTLAVPEAIRSDNGALSAGATPTTGVKQQNHTPAGPRRSLFASLDAPRDAVASAMTAAAVGARAGGECPNGPVNTASLHHLWNCTNDMAATTAISLDSVSSSSFSFAPTPPSASMSAAAATRHTSDLGAADADRRFMLLQQQQQAGQPSRRESNFSVSGGASFGELFMSKSEETLPLTLGAPNSIEFSDAAAAAPMGVDVDMSSTLASTTVSAKHTGGRRARLWRIRTFVLSYDHPAGHLLCRALGVLLRPAPDAVGEGARAALDKDLLDALKRALAAFTARSTSEQDNDEGGGGGGGGAGKAASTTVVEVVHYLPPESSSATVADGGDPNQREAEAHWMRFKVTTNERKGVMAQLLQEVLNVPLSEQCACFERLLQFVGQHVKCGEELDGESSAEDLWDPVRAIERAARSSAAVRARLEIAYGGDAATAVHTRHQYYDAADATLAPISDAGGGAAAAPGAELNGTDNTEGVVRLDHLYSALWKELGLPVSGTARDALPHAPASLCIKEEEAEAPVSGDRRPQLLDRRASGGDLYMFPLTSCDATSRRSSEAAIPLSVPPSAAVHQQRLHVVNLYDRGSGELKLREWESLPAPLREGQRDDAFASAAATGDDQGGMEGAEDDRETSADSASVTTPEKQLGYARDMELGGTAAELLPPLFALGDSNAEAPQQGSPPVGVALTDQLMGLSPPLETCNTAGAAVAPSFSQQQQQVPRASLAATEDEKGQQHMDDDSGESDMPRVVTSRLRIGQQSGEERSGSSGEAGSSVGGCSAMLSRPQQELSEGRQHTQPGLAHPGVTGVQAEEAEGEEDIVIAPPIRVQRRSSQLVGRIKTFTLSYTHQEGTAVCRAWRLLHSAMHVYRSKSANSNSASCDASVDVVAPISPPASLSLSVLAKEAQKCLCDDFLAFLQPPDEDIEHAVLSVSLNCDSSVATAMLQVQVQTNERRAALADRLQHSNHGVRRSVGRDHRSGLVPLSVQEVDRFYFPRLTHLLRQYKTVADMVVQVQTFLQPRAALQDRLLQSYGSIAALVHYYHGSSAALEHELGISSWQVLMDPTPLGTARAQQLADDVLSPTVAVDRVQRRRNVVAEEGHQGGGALCEGEPRTPNPQPQPATAGAPQLSRLASANDGASGATNLQGRPPPHPRRLPTPPHAITHTSSISFDEVTEDSTSEEGPVVVLRCTTPTKTSHSPFTPKSFHVQYTSGMHQQVFSTTSPSRPVVEGVSERGALNESGGYLDAGTDTGLVSPLTAISSTAGSPNQQHLGLSLEHPAATGAVAPSENSLSTQPVPHLLLQPAGDKDAAAAPPGAKSGCDSRQYHYSEASGSATTAAVPVSSSSPLVMSAPKTKTIVGSSTSGYLAPPFQQLAEYNHSNAGGNSNATLQPPQVNPRRLVAAAGASDSSSVTGLDQCKSEYERVLQGKYKRLMRVAYDGVVRGSVPLDPQHQQKTVIGRGKWGAQKVELSLEWEILFVLTFEKSRKLGRSSRRAQMLVHPVGCGFECAAGDDLSHTASSGIFCGGDALSPQSSAISGELGECGHHPSMVPMSKMPRKKEPSRSAASHLIITIQRPFTPDEVGSSSHNMEETVMAGALLTVSSSKPGRLLGGGSDDTSNTSRASTGANQAVQEYVFQLCQPSLTLVIEMKSSKHVQEALRLLKNSIRRATQAVNKSMLNAQIPPPVLTSSSLPVAHHGPLS